MCGIVVWITRDEAVSPRTLVDATTLLRHRGPDNSRAYLWARGRGSSTDLIFDPEREALPKERFNVGLGHTRLSIIDPTLASAQPLVSPSGDVVLIYNGEIYNYIEERERLRDRGCVFRSSGDGEVLLHALLAEGTQALRRLNGMWALACLSKRDNTIVFSRDRFGKKPLFYYQDAQQFIAASEIKSIFAILGTRRVVDARHMTGYVLGYIWPTIEDGSSFYRGIKTLPAGCSASLDLETFRFEVHEDNQIYDFLESDPDPSNLAEDLESAVSLRLRADVPVAVSVSGGVDSSLIAAMAARQRPTSELSFFTFRLPADNSIDSQSDHECANLLAEALGVEIQSVDLEIARNADDLIADYRRLTRAYELPVNPFLVAHPGYVIARAVAQRGVRVLLDGTGGDEIFGGYTSTLADRVWWHVQQGRPLRAAYWRLHMQRYARGSFKGALLECLSYLKAATRGAAVHHIDRTLRCVAAYSRYAGIEDLSAHRAAAGIGRFFRDPVDSQIHALTRGVIPYYNYVNDQNSMINSIEARSPFLDYRLAKYVRLPLRQKWRGGFNKYLLRQSLPDTVPDRIRWRRNKLGFGYRPALFVAENRSLLTQRVRASDFLRQSFDVERLMADQRRVGEDPTFDSFLRQLFFLALWAEEYALRVE